MTSVEQTEHSEAAAAFAAKQAERKTSLLENKPFGEVNAVFADFIKTHTGLDSEFVRGGHPYPNKKPLTENTHVAPNFHVEATFSEVETPYIVRCASLLTLIAKGSDGVFLSSAIMANFDVSEQRSFVHAVHLATLELITEFGSRYPNLLPALNAMFLVGGGEGVNFAVRLSAGFLQDKLKSANPRARKPHAPHGEFSGLHPKTANTPSEYEVICSGMILAKEIFAQADLAATQLAIEIQQNDLPYEVKLSELWSIEGTRDASETLVQSMYLAEKTKYQAAANS